MQIKAYNQAIDILRVISILAVILIHTTTKTLGAINLDVQQLPWSLFLNQICRFAVPLFFIISGFVLELNYHEEFTYWQYLKKRFSRVLVPYVFWSLIYYYLVYKNQSESIGYALFSGEASYQLYFIPALLIFYLIFPLLHRWYKLIGNKWILLILAGLELGLLYFDYYVKPFSFFDPINIVLLNYFSFIFGMVMCHHQIKIMNLVDKWKYGLMIITIIAGNLVFYQGGSRFLQTSNYLDFYSQWRPNVLIYSILFTVLWFYLFSKIENNFKIIKKLSKLSFLVFFVHVIVIEILWPTVFINLLQMRNWLWGEKIWFDLLFFTTIAGISFGIAWIMQKIPVVRKISG